MKFLLRHTIYTFFGFILAMMISASAWAQDSLAQYHPLGKGNIWIYKISYPSGSFNYRRLEVKGDSTIGGRSYRIIATTNNLDSVSRTSVERYDVATGCYYTRSGNSEVLQDSTFTFTPQANFGGEYGGKYNTRVFERLDTRTVLGATIPTRQITEGNFLKEDMITWSYAYGIGLISAADVQLANYISAWWQTLLYAKIDGKEYGTIPVKVEDAGIELPSSIVLSQNFPNPFNPVTIISFALPKRTNVSLKIYDVMGKEVAVLNSGELEAGKYSREWNAAGMPSGMYFYRLQAGSMSETKKLLLAK